MIASPSGNERILLRWDIHAAGLTDHVVLSEKRLHRLFLLLPGRTWRGSWSCPSKASPGTTFKKHMAIAKDLMSEDNSLLAEVLFNDHSIAQIEKAASRLTFLKHIVKGKGREELFLFFGKLRGNIS